MANLSLRFPPGVVRTASAGAVEGRWWGSNLMRWVGGNPRPIKGWERSTSTALTSIPRQIMPWNDDGDIIRIGMWCDDKLLVYSDSSAFDATPTAFVGTGSYTSGGYGTALYGEDDDALGEDYGEPRSGGRPRRPWVFTLDTWGQTLVGVASSDGRLVQYNPSTPTTAAAAITGAPTNNTACIVTPERHIQLLGADGERRRFAWCSREDETDWDFADPTNTAGYLDLETDGYPITMRLVREGTLIFTDTDVWLARFIGAPYIHSVTRIADGVSPLSPQCIATFDGRCVWPSKNGFQVYESGVVKPLPSDIGDYILSHLSLDWAPYRAHASAHGMHPEVWFFAPDSTSTDGECNRYAVWNYQEGWWALGSLPRSAMCPAGVENRGPYMAGSDSHLYLHEQGYLAADAGSRVGLVYLESGEYGIADGDAVAKVSHARADSSGAGYDATRVTFYGKMQPDTAETTYGPYTADANGYVWCRFTSRLVRVRLENMNDADWSPGPLRLEVKPGGKR